MEMKNFARILLTLFMVTFMVFTNANVGYVSSNGIVADSTEMECAVDSVHIMRVQACTEYMEWVLKNQGKKLSATDLDPEAVVTVCEENSFSIPFVLAVANLESCFGITPRAKKTNSVFSVGLFDNGKNMISYSHPNESISSFVDLIQNDYLFNGRTINDLLKSGGFVNRQGMRYATSAIYERQVRSIMNRIIKRHPVLVIE